MGHRKTHAPKHGSLAYLPRHRAKKPVARIRHWPKIKADSPKLLAFSAYKAGMTYVFTIEDRKRSPNFGKEVMRAATILETPPIMVCGIRTYGKTPYGLTNLTEAWMKEPPAILDRKLVLPDTFDTDAMLQKLQDTIEQASAVRVICATQPSQTSLAKKKPEIMEIQIGGGNIQQQFDYAKQLLGKTVTPEEVFKDGQYIDIAGITVGKGYQGPVKRWGVTKLQHKGRKTKRGIATLGPWNPHHLMYSIPRAGQMGYHQRIEFNKRILKIGKDGKEVTVKGGFIRYGEVNGPYIIISGSVAGTEKRTIRLRVPARPPTEVPDAAPQITYTSLESPQGK
ncbi:MAG TPA: 50S ribosomal protein L3 [Candidatus Deferrimicrobiaceae bacterium]|jgi:large subunit ribosomal protein L3|nr:50S ribosomal protein L3 [Candidatus Deferrimicrobiaceae bacterium]